MSDRRHNRERDRRDGGRLPRSSERDRERDREKRMPPPPPPQPEREKDRKRKAGDIDLDAIMKENNDLDSVNAKLNEVMQKSRENVERWRQQRKLAKAGGGEAAAVAGSTSTTDASSTSTSSAPESQSADQPSSAADAANTTAGSNWSLDKEEDDDEGEESGQGGDNNESGTGKSTVNGSSSSNNMMEVVVTNGSNNSNGSHDIEEVDPLDEYMTSLSGELRGGARASARGSTAATAAGEPPRARVIVIQSSSSTAAGPSFKGEIVESEDSHQHFSDDMDLDLAVNSSLLSKGRHLAATDHTKVYYRPFRKNFYNEVPDLAKMTKKDVEQYRKELDDLRVRGNRCPKPLKKWAQCGVELRILNALKHYKYEKPTPIQCQAIPAIMAGRDVIGIAKTGSGKTLAFLLPMFRHILDQPPLEEMDGPIALIMSPTRELALQTWKEANKFANLMGIRAVCVYGGVGISEQIADLKKGAEVVVCTPGRMIDMLAVNNGKVTNLRRITYLVLDEADRMFDMGFEPQVTKIVNNIRPDRQTVLFSATFPKHMEALARKVLEKPIEIQVGGKSVVCSDIEQNALIIEEEKKFLKLLELLGQYSEQGNVLVFVEKQEKADDLISQLMQSGYNCAPLHGGIDQFDRDSTIVDFKLGRLKLMVATSVAARGLDVKKLVLVVNYDCPNHYEDYVHRVGRTGRAGNKGVAFTFILPEGQEKMAGEVCRAFELAGVTPPPEVKKHWDDFRQQMREQGIEIHTGSSGGFSGSGYRYDADEDETEANKRKMTQLVHGMETAGDDDDADIEDCLAGMMKSKQRVVKARYRSAAEAAAAETKMAAARAAAERIATAKQLNTPQPAVEKDVASLTAEAIMRGEQDPTTPQLSGASVAKQKAVELNEKLNYLPSQFSFFDDADQHTQYFEEELEINDFPQQIRYKVCSRDSIAQVQEFSDVGISVKGTHYPTGKEPKPGERKLYLLLEARNEITLRRAKEEVLRIMRESLRQMMATGNRGQTGGRYKLF